MEKKENKKSKRAVSKLHSDFRERICDYAIDNDLKCAPALILLKLTGCRPNELKKGILVSVTEDNCLKFIIRGSKLNLKQNRGMVMRKIQIKLSESDKYKTFLENYIKSTSENGKSTTITITSENSFSGYISKISKRLWPRKTYHASAYSFRHQVASDLKNSGMDEVEIAQFLGHASTRSQESYGRKRRRGKGEEPTQNLVGDIVGVQTSSEPRKNDRLLRFKIASKNRSAVKVSSMGEALGKLNTGVKSTSTKPVLSKKLKR